MLLWLAATAHTWPLLTIADQPTRSLRVWLLSHVFWCQDPHSLWIWLTGNTLGPL